MNVEEKYVEISCPSLMELCLKISRNWTCLMVILSVQLINNVLSGSPFLRTLELAGFVCPGQLVIALKSLKKLVLGGLYTFSDLEISCPCLEESNIYHCFPSTSRGKLEHKTLAVKILRQLQHVKLLGIGGWLIQTLQVEGSSSLLLNCKCFTWDGADFDGKLCGILSTISCLPLLEKLVIKFPLNQWGKAAASLESNNCRKKSSSDSDGVVFNCSVSNLKTVEIIGLSGRDDKCKLVFDFVEFLLKNGRVLEKIVVILALADCGERFLFDVSRKLLSLLRYSPNMTIELCSTCPDM